MRWLKVIGLSLLLALTTLAISACGDDGNGDPDTPCSEYCEALCQRDAECSSYAIDGDGVDPAQECLDNCAMVEPSAWGDTMNMAPLACYRENDCTEFRLCQLKGGKVGMTCGGITDETAAPPEYEPTCAGLCQRLVDCEEQSDYYQDECVRQCAESLQNGWTDPAALQCVDALGCDRYANCVWTIYYNSDWNSGDVDGDVPPDIGEPNIPNDNNADGDDVAVDPE